MPPSQRRTSREMRSRKASAVMLTIDYILPILRRQTHGGAPMKRLIRPGARCPARHVLRVLRKGAARLRRVRGRIRPDRRGHREGRLLGGLGGPEVLVRGLPGKIAPPSRERQVRHERLGELRHLRSPPDATSSPPGDVIYLYLEPVGQALKEAADGRHEFGFQADFSLEDAAGKVWAARRISPAPVSPPGTSTPRSP